MPPGARTSIAPYKVYPLWEVLRQTASRLPQKVAVIDGEREFTFSQLDEKSDRLAAALAGLGVEKADRVGLFAPNCAEFIIGFFGIIKAGATVTPVNAAYRERELAHQLGNAGAKVIIAHQALLPVVQAARGELPELETVIVIGEADHDIKITITADEDLDDDKIERAKRQIARDKEFIGSVRQGAVDVKPVLCDSLARIRAACNES
ncbi:MAG: AMP-binding protein [Chloroflexi bacterium]|nr:AMP-binding protein [Chloroflexota bacterium]